MLKKIFKYLLIAIIAGYTLFAIVVIPTFENGGTYKGMLIEIDNNDMNIITHDEIVDIIEKKGLDPTGKGIDTLACGNIERFINNLSIVDECQVYKSIKDYVVVNVKCRKPIVKVIDANKASYHIDEDGEIIYGIEKALYLPIASGEINDSTRNEVTTVARIINEDEFWSSQVEQIYFDRNGKIIMIPRVGNHIIEFGKAENTEEKLNKLYTFYKNGMNEIGWNKYNKVNIEFSDKVICTKRDRYGKK